MAAFQGKGIVRTYWLESEQNNLVNRYRFLNRKMSDEGTNPTVVGSKVHEILHNQLSDESYTESFGLGSANRGESIGEDTLMGVDRETISDQFAEQQTPLLLSKSAST